VDGGFMIAQGNEKIVAAQAQAEVAFFTTMAQIFSKAQDTWTDAFKDNSSMIGQMLQQLMQIIDSNMKTFSASGH
jgi:hypothetical protein